ncbi:MAG: ABC transporter substrate-binding protein [Phycisphaerae bacterium]
MVATSTAALAEVPDFTPEQMGGTLRRCFSAEPQTLNPITGKDLYERYVNEYVFQYLLQVDVETGELKGDLARTWNISDDGLVITFHLHPEARFSDGHPVTAEDVVFTYNLVMNPEIDARSMASYLSKCERCEAVDDHAVRFVWKEKYFKVAESSGNLFPILPKHLYAKNVEVAPEEAEAEDITHFNDLVQGIVGSGPYTFDSWDTGRRITLVRNEKFWGKPRAFDRITFQIITEERASVQAFLSGDLDYISITPEWRDKLKDHPKRVKTHDFEIYQYSSPANGYSFIGWNNAEYVTVEQPDGTQERVATPHPLFADWRVRRAMTHLIDRRALLKYLYDDIGTIATGPFWSQSPQYPPGCEPWPHDRKEAMRLLAEAGWKDRDGNGWLENEAGKQFVFEWTMPSGHQQTMDLARIIKEEFRRSGIEVETKFVDWPVFVRALDSRDFDAVILAWGGSAALEKDPYQIWHSDAIADQGHNFISFESAEGDRLIEAARSEMDFERRTRLFREFHRLLHGLQPYTFFIERKSLRLVNKRLRNVKVYKLGMDPEEWWIPPEARLDQRSRFPRGGSPNPPRNGKGDASRAVGTETHRANAPRDTAETDDGGTPP